VVRGADVLHTLLEAVGFVLVVAAAYFVALPLALFVAGVGLILVANVTSSRRSS
jgi:hypothetical protein